MYLCNACATYMKYTTLISFLVAVLLLAGCYSDNKYISQLDAAEGLLYTAPDSALALLQEIDSRRLSRADNALYALLLSQARDKCYIDETNDSLINIAVEYYSKTEESKRLFMAYYYQGRVLQNANSHHAAIESFTKAEQLINEFDDNKTKGMLYAHKGRLYTIFYDLPKALEEYKKSHEYYVQGDVTTHIPHALLNIGNILLYTKQYNEAAEYITEAATRYRALGKTAKCNEALILLSILYTYSDNYPALDSLLHSPHFDSVPHNLHYYLAHANLYSAQGQFDKAERYIQQARCISTTINDTISIYYSQYLIDRNQRRFEPAFASLKQLYVVQDSLVHITLQQPLITAQRDYYSQLAETKAIQYENSRQRQLLFLMTTIIAVLVVVIVILVFLRRIATQNAILTQYINIVHELKQTISQTSYRMDEMSLQVNMLFSQLYAILDEQCVAYYECKDNPQKEKILYKHLHNKISQLTADDALHKKLEGIINKYNNNIVELARTHIANIKEKDIQIMCYIYAGFSARSISIIMDESIQNIYTRKSRIKSSINKLPDEIKNRLLKNM